MLFLSGMRLIRIYRNLMERKGIIEMAETTEKRGVSAILTK